MSENSYSLKFTPKASEDLEQIYSYIAGKLFAEIAADNLLERIESSIMRLKSFPYSCSFVFDEPLKNRGYRKLIVDNYVVFYLVNELEKQVVIMRILYGAQNYQDLL
ncbi:MAG: type II toxin-antitoxin system RelE/ParE family toxin [Dethiobacter sp.]|jgi:addiction module RelE/StbE family toxin|nr:MAG: type II toxin-antitoxin system RelE/ParE family toxin [Dethiobacter sp.]